MEDLRCLLGLRTAREYIWACQLGYLGHLGRYKDTRVELRMLFSGLSDYGADGVREPGGTVTLRRVYWDHIKRIMGRTGYPEDAWAVAWRTVAGLGPEAVGQGHLVRAAGPRAPGLLGATSRG